MGKLLVKTVEVDRHRLEGEIDLAALLKELSLCATTSEARRLIDGGGVEVDGVKIRTVRTSLTLTPDKALLFKVGKRGFLLVKPR